MRWPPRRCSCRPAFVPALLAPALTARIDNLATGRTLGRRPARAGGGNVFSAAGAALRRRPSSLAPILALALADGILALTARSLMRGSVAGILKQAGLLREGNAISQRYPSPAQHGRRARAWRAC